jgi:hypothetical protein
MYFATLFCGISIKIMDDYLDLDMDLLRGKSNSVALIGNGAVAYALLSILAATLINREVAVVLFCAAYCIGMGNSSTADEYHWAETVMVAIFSIFLSGAGRTSVALLLMAALQIHDNLADNEPLRLLQTLLGREVSKIAAQVIAASLGITAIAINPLFSIVVVFNYFLFFAFERWLSLCI